MLARTVPGFDIRAAGANARAAAFAGVPITRTVVLKDKQPEGENAFRLVFADPPVAALPAWSAGAHVDVVAGGLRRKYSLCGEADDRQHLQVVIQREAEGRGGSRHFCDQLQSGDTVQLAGPKNLFRLDETADHYVLIAAGIGITPMLAERLETEIKYAGYIARQDRMIRDVARHEKTLIPEDFEYADLTGLTLEAREKLARIRPKNLGQAGRIPGVSPSDVAQLSIALAAKRS